MTNTITEIERLTRAYATERRTLSERVLRLEEERRAIVRKLLPGVKSAVQRAEAARTELEDTIRENPGLFKKPRTITIEGIKVGFTKGKGKTEIHDEENSIRLIRKHLADQADALIKKKESLIRSALKNLTAAEAKRVGIEITDAGDKVVIHSTDTDLDKLVEALIDAASDDNTKDPA